MPIKLKDLTTENVKCYHACMIFKMDHLKSLEWILTQGNNSPKGRNLSQ